MRTRVCRRGESALLNGAACAARDRREPAVPAVGVRAARIRAEGALPTAVLRVACGLAAFLLALCSQRAAALPSQWIPERTAHFAIDGEGEGPEVEAEVRELGVVLEQAWAAYAKLLQAEPVLERPAQFVVRVCADRESWIAAIERTGVVPGANLDSLCFVPERDTAFLYRQPTRWLTRRLALHGTWQQFHYRAKAKHADLVNSWFVLGLAEQLAIHRWNGKQLELGARPRITVLDLPGQAARALDGRDGLEALSEGGMRRPENAWALVSFLREGKGGKYRARFDKLALGHTGSKLTGPEFAATLGKPEQVYGELLAWLGSVQEPLIAACGDWEDLDGRELLGRAPQDDYAFAVVRQAATEVRARFVGEPGSSAGLLLAYEDQQHYTFAALGDRGVVVKRCEGVRLSTLDEFQGMPSKDGTQRLHARRSEGRVTLFVEERETASFEVAGDRLGLAVEKGAARFVEVSWK
jgi:hypothetical protein